MVHSQCLITGGLSLGSSDCETKTKALDINIIPAVIHMRTNGADITTLCDFVGANGQVKLSYMEHMGG